MDCNYRLNSLSFYFWTLYLEDWASAKNKATISIVRFLQARSVKLPFVWIDNIFLYSPAVYFSKFLIIYLKLLEKASLILPKSNLRHIIISVLKGVKTYFAIHQ